VGHESDLVSLVSPVKNSLNRENNKMVIYVDIYIKLLEQNICEYT